MKFLIGVIHDILLLIFWIIWLPLSVPIFIIRIIFDKKFRDEKFKTERSDNSESFYEESDCSESYYEESDNSDSFY